MISIRLCDIIVSEVKNLDFKNLKELRCERNLFQKDIANYLGITAASYSLYESNKRTPPIEMLIKLCEFYNVDMEQLIGWRNPEYHHAAPLKNTEQSLAQKDIRQKPKLNSVQAEACDLFRSLLNGEQIASQKQITVALQLRDILKAYSRLNDTGREETVKRVKELTEIRRYSSPTAPQNKSNVRNEQGQLPKESKNEYHNVKHN